MHLSEKAVEPPGEAKSDLDIFLDYARRMDFRDNDGQPLIKWDDPESAFEAWKECSRGRPCDYTGITYEKLRGSSGVQWPCNNEHPDGTERLYADGDFNTETNYCETYSRDLLTGAESTEMEHKALAPSGRAFLLAAEYQPLHEEPGEEYPFSYITGRTIYHFHTRTKTARAPQLQGAAPDVWVEIHRSDADNLGVGEGDVVRLESPRGKLEAKVRVSGIKEGVGFAPFHYGYFDEPDGQPRAANELTITEWDPASKQPLYKIGAARVRKVADARGTPARAPTTTAYAPTSGVSVSEPSGVRLLRSKRSSERSNSMHLANYLGYLHRAELNLAEGFRKVGEAYTEEADVYHTCNTLAKQCEAHAEKLQSFVERYGEEAPEEPENLYHELFGETRSGGLGLLRDMQDLYLMANACDISWTMIGQAAQGTRDRQLLEVVNACEEQTATQIKWLKTRMKQAAPQALLVAS